MLHILKTYFGYDTFRPLQQNIIQNILDKKDTLVLMPTGGGKSICYQLPALMMDGTTIVVSPLISLMKDQVESLRANGIAARAMNSTNDETENFNLRRECMQGKIKLLYISPERLLMEMNFLLKDIHISLVAIDEAHCISQWGHDFRKSYTKISKFISLFSPRPVIAAFTATATNIVKNDIINSLNLINPFTIVTTFNRENLFFSVFSHTDKLCFLLNFLKSNKFDSGIIYCSSRKNVDYLYDYLSFKKYSVCKYHAGLPPFQKIKYQNLFLSDHSKIMIATNAFGMGIDKPNIRYCLLYTSDAADD